MIGAAEGIKAELSKPEERFKVKASSKTSRCVFDIVEALKASGRGKDLNSGKRVHAEAVQSGVGSNIFVASTLVDMYSKCGSLRDAEDVFNGMRARNSVSWNALMRGYVLNGESDSALELYERMQEGQCSADGHTFVAALKACTPLAAREEVTIVGGEFVKAVALEKGMAIHRQAAEAGCDSDIFVENTLVDLYSKCRSMKSSQMVFDKMKQRDVVSWTTIILGYAQCGDGEEALRVFQWMRGEGCDPNALTYVAVIKACSTLAEMGEEDQGKHGKTAKICSLEKGMAIHSEVVRNGFDSSMFVGSTLIDMYAKCGSMEDSLKVFESMECVDVVSWTALILGFAEADESETALHLLVGMTKEACSPNNLTFVAALKACSSLAAREEGTPVDGKLVKMRSLETGMFLHSQAAQKCFVSDIFVSSTLVDVYATCGSMLDARKCFDRMRSRTVVVWTALLLGYAQNGESLTALDLFESMQAQGFAADARALVVALKACVSLAEAADNRHDKSLKLLSLEKGRSVHLQAKKLGSDVSNRFVAGGLVEMYARCGSMREAREVFQALVRPDIMLWNLMISGYSETEEDCRLALELFACIDRQPDAQTFVVALKACGNMTGLGAGKEVHAQACRFGLDSDAAVASSLVHFYGKCGSTAIAQQVFDSVPSKDLMLWTGLIAGYSRRGDTELVFSSFRKMVDEGGPQPDGIVFNYVLTACSHAGLIHKGKQCFELMRSKFGVLPAIENYHTVIDMLCRVNQLEEAVEVAECGGGKACFRGVDEFGWR